MDHTGTAFGPPWFGALKCALFLFGIPILLTFVAIAIWPNPEPKWAFPVSMFASVGIWFGMLFTWISLRTPSLRQRIDFFANQNCPVCGQLIGREASAKAQQVYSEACSAARRSIPGARINFARYWTHICTGCKTKLQLRFEDLTVSTKAEQGMGGNGDSAGG
jgi:hypothetical protein